MILLALALTTTKPLAAEAATRAAIDRIRTRDARVHAVIAIDPTAIPQARAIDRSRKARGPLYAMPILLKDNIEAKGPLPTTAGSLALAENVTNRDAPLVAQLRAADAVILGKTNLSEWANFRSSHSSSGWSGVGGQTHNAHAIGRTPCGSSSGSAAAVAEGLVDAAIGTETDGSVTCPAAVNGVVGLKPTVGLVSRTHIVPISHSQDTAGPITRDVTTAARLLTAIAGSDPDDPATATADAHKTDYVAALDAQALKGARIGVVRLKTWSPAVSALFERALDVLRKQGATLVDVDLPAGGDRIGPAETMVLNTEFKVDVAAYLATTPPQVRSRTLADLIAFNRAHAAQELAVFGQEKFEEAEKTRGLDDPAYREARDLARRLAGPEGIDAMLRDHDVTALIAPTRGPAWMIDHVNGDQSPPGGIGRLPAVAGYPHLTVPMGNVSGLPVGLSFIGPAWSEARLLGLGYSYEQAAHIQPAPLAAK